MEETKPLLTFEDVYLRILKVVTGKKHKWKLEALRYIEWKDIEQELLSHVSQKFHLWDQSRPIEPYVSILCENQLINKQRNLYYNFAKPCIGCPQSEGEEGSCRLFGSQDPNQCNLLANWSKHKKGAYSVKLPASLNYHENEVFNKPHEIIDIEKAIERFHIKMHEVLKPLEYKIYNHLYIEKRGERELAGVLGYKTTEGRTAGYKSINNMKKLIVEKAKELMRDEDLDVFDIFGN